MKKGPGQYHVKEPLEFAELVRMHQRAAKAFSLFTDVSTPEIRQHFTWFAANGLPMPPAKEMDAVHWQSLTLHSRSAAGTGSLERMAAILRRGLPAISKEGHLQVDLGFQRQGTQQKPKHYDEVFILAARGKLFLGYKLGWAYPQVPYYDRKALFTRLFQVAHLPLRLAKGTKQHGETEFSLQHTAGGEVEVYRHDDAPEDFRCEMAGATLADLLQRVDAVLNEFACPKPSTLNWSIGQESLSLCKRIYAAATRFPGKLFMISPTIHLDSIEAADQLRGVCGKSNKFTWQLCGFTLPSARAKGGQVELKLWVVSNLEGHRLSLEMKPVDPPLLPEIKKKLKAEFRVLA